MFRKISLALTAGASCLAAGLHQAAAVEAAPLPEPSVIYADQPAPPAAAPLRTAYAERSNMGGGFIEFLFGDGQNQGERYQQAPVYQQQPAYDVRRPPLPQAEPQQGGFQQESAGDPTRRNGKALRYGIGVGKPGFTWSGVKQISAKKEWPDWTPPAEMLVRRPDLPRHMEGGPQNPLGARAMYLGSSLYRIHGSNEPWTIGTNVSSGCIRMRNEDVIDLYGRVNVGARVVVI
jgi:lipoprotein-anchoring transpeptidase ErfK/SrfK